jgi:hypothetical protein
MLKDEHHARRNLGGTGKMAFLGQMGMLLNELKYEQAVEVPRG